MGLGGALLRLTNDLVRPFGFKLIRQEGPGQPRKVFPRGNFFDVLETHVSASDPVTIFDVGAYNGISAKRFCEIFPLARIHSFEPSPDSHDALDEMARLPEYATRIVPHRLALSSQSGHRLFYRHQAPQTDSLLDTHPHALNQWPDGRFVPIPAIETPVETIDQFCTREGIDYIDILKIDAQGEDLRILRGAESTLTQDKIGIIVVELYFVPVYQSQGEPHEIIQYLIDKGFANITYLCHDIDRSGKLLCVDAIFERKKKA